MANLDTNRAIELIRQGNAAEGAKLLSEVLQTSPDDEQAWLWMSACVPGQDKKIYCLQRVLQINPNNAAARRGLETYGVAVPQAVVAPPAQKPVEPKADSSAFSYSDLNAAMGDRDESKISELTSAPEEEEKVAIPENFTFENGPVIEEPAPAETQSYQPAETVPVSIQNDMPLDTFDMDALKEEASQIDIKPAMDTSPVIDSSEKAVMMEDMDFTPPASTEPMEPVASLREEISKPMPRPVRRRRKTNWLLVIVIALLIVLLILVAVLKVFNVI